MGRVGQMKMRLKMHWAVEGYLPFWTKEKEDKGPGLQKKSRQFAGRQERANMSKNIFFAGLPRNNEVEGSSTSRLC